MCMDLTHFDPCARLPPELMLHVLRYLLPKDLLNAGRVSREWRDRASDEELWKALFTKEGWVMDVEKMNEYGRERKRMGSGPTWDGRLERRGSKRRADQAFGRGDVSPITGRPQADGATLPIRSLEPMTAEDAVMTDYTARAASPAIHSHPSQVIIRPPMFAPLSRPDDDPKISWPYLYKQRTVLEHRWDTGKYKTFSLPHPEHLDEGHKECVYAMQHTPTHLVSGGRDTTIRRWDLATQRLIKPVLCGHEASVLCLQFDSRPTHDIIVSGGSDNFVITWRFSTGEQIKKMTTAHNESVLNLRFDDRYLITCSKDKTIKLWNREALSRSSPLIPAHVVDLFANATDCLNLHTGLINPFTLITTLTGHQAAVNAVCLLDNTIVSASGDRTIKSWDINRGKHIKTYSGHSKGIACVQYDGRRIISGSSDNTVRIFDARQTVEIGRLTAHTNLVRSVQARFGDLLTTTDDELRVQSKAIDKAYRTAEAVSRMRPLSPAMHGGRLGLRNAGNAIPQDVVSLGAAVPAGGGGERWAKIVSGSYDETVRIWRKERGTTSWVTRCELRQESVLGQRRRTPVAAPAPAPASAHHAPPPPAGGLSALTQQTTTVNTSTTTTAPPPPQAHGPPARNPASESNRVFKLQFDARRVVCCSQNKMIVGWDFAGDDQELQLVGGWSIETM